MKKISGIYQIKNKINGKIYVGSSNNICLRWWHHKYNALEKNSTKCPKLYAALRKYGVDAFEWTVLLECDQTELYKEEQNWLNENFLSSNYNVSKFADAPMRGKTFSELHIAKLKNARSRRKISNETKLKMSKSKLGKRHSSHTIKKLSGENNKNSKYTWNIINDIRNDYDTGMLVKDIINKYNLPKTTAWNIIKQNTWKPM